MSSLDNFRGSGRAGILDTQLYAAAGIDVKTRSPMRIKDSQTLKDIKRIIRIVDEQDAVNRFIWEKLPTTVDGQQLERLVYYKGQLVFFKFQDKYYFMPYALDGTIDFYGRYNRVHPVPMTSGTDDKGEISKLAKNQMALLADLKLNIIYDENQLEEGVDYSINASPEREAYGIILRDYTNQLSQVNIPRAELNDVIVELEAETLCLMETSLIIGSGISGVRVPDADSFKAVEEGAVGLKKYAINGIPWIPIKGTIDFQELTGTQRTAIQDYFLAMQSLDNFRLSTYGLDNSGLFEKQSHILNDENQINQQKYHYVQFDSLQIREKFCDLVKKVFNIDINVKINEKAEAGTLGGEEKAHAMSQTIFSSGGGNSDEYTND